MKRVQSVILRYRNMKYTNMDIQRATAADAENILHLQRVAFISEAEIYNDFSIPPLFQSLDELKGEFSTHIFFKGDSRWATNRFGKSVCKRWEMLHSKADCPS